jgi:hypothetical protein
LLLFRYPPGIFSIMRADRGAKMAESMCSGLWQQAGTREAEPPIMP